MPVNICTNWYCMMLFKSLTPDAMSLVWVEYQENSSFFQFVQAHLANKVTRCFNETKAEGKEFDYRFTGWDFRMFLNTFMYLIESMESPTDTVRQTLILHMFAFASLQLRNAVLLFCRFTINDEIIKSIIFKKKKNR